MHQLRRHLKHKADSLRRQAVANNAGGRSRTIDHLLPVAEDGRRAKPSGKGGWKKWTPEALLRAAFASENAALRQVAQEVDGASAAHARRARLFVAQLIEQTQREGMDRECRQMAHAATEAGQGPLFHILNIMFDETELDVALHGLGPGTWSILASHAQISVRAADQTRDYDIVRPPQALPNKTAPCMFGALCQNLGGLWPSEFAQAARFPVVLVTCDQFSANIRLLKHLHASLPEHCYLLPNLCAQHRNGNVVERVTKALGVLPGAFCVAKTLSRGQKMRSLIAAVKTALQGTLIVLPQEPPGLQAEWLAGRQHAAQFLELAFGAVTENKRRARRAQEFLAFFAGPWLRLSTALRDRLLFVSSRFAQVHALALATLSLGLPAMADSRFVEASTFGLGKCFLPGDLRSSQLRGLWPSPEMGETGFAEGLGILKDYLVTDAYGGVSAVRYARDEYNRRSPMHVMLDIPGGGKLWLGGQAALTPNSLMQNEISVVWPACRAVVGEEETCCARFLEPVDGTAVVHNDVPLAQLLELVDEVIRLLVVEKRSVLSVCRNGAHRSATLLCLTLMRLFGWTAQECERHVTQLRNIVDMRSRAPPSARRVNTVRPVDWLAEVSDQVRQDRPVYDVAVNQMCTPLQLTQKALSLGFVNRCFVRKVRKLEAPMSGPKPGEGREGDVTESDAGSTVLVGRKERSSSGDGADTSV
ncbi:unnamed protein product [Effrenium voratum]|uniref:Tyrosine specific protein phosphatases domain-containing protein n=1 Tax=Effrenium voratum TaxID=2562239 RepID=A0AA36MR35_9DINO|nr:unnamed protein product [Effrenium voratum]